VEALPPFGYECYVPEPPGRKLSRRRVLAAVGGGLAVAAGAVAFARTRGYALPEAVVTKLEALAPWQYVVVASVARRIAAPDREDAGLPSADDTDVAGFVDGYVARLPPPLRRDLLRALAFVEHVAPLLVWPVGRAARFTRLSPRDQDRVLASLEANGQDLLRGAFDGLKSLVFMGYYRDPRTWKILSYDGPRVNRPAGGWWQ
jgi:hypothetical protein